MSNQAAFILEKGASVHVDTAPMPRAKPGMIVIRNKAVAVNPVDWKMRQMGFVIPSWPTILGFDCAGVIHEVGQGVEGFEPGQRVLARPLCVHSKDTTQSAFQLYTAVLATQVTILPDTMSFEAAATVPVSITTAAAGLYEDNALKLPFPSEKSSAPGKAVLVWGGSSSVGSSVIQLAKASGFDVITTASAKNFEFVKSLGATTVINYNEPSCETQILQSFKGLQCAGAFDAIGLHGDQCARIVDKLGGGHVTSVLDPPKTLPLNVTTNRVYGSSTAYSPSSKALFHEYLPKALAEGTFIPAPPVLVVGHGLEMIEEGMARLKEGVSATKLVVTL